MLIRLTNFLRKTKVQFSLQSRFQNSYSANYALISLTEMIRNVLDKGNFASGIFIDLQKAFDIVNHNIRLSKLNHYGIRGVAFNWYKSYLSGRTQYKTINNKRSEIFNIKYGRTTRLHLRIIMNMEVNMEDMEDIKCEHEGHKFERRKCYSNLL